MDREALLMYWGIKLSVYYKEVKVITEQGLMWFYSKIQHLNRLNRIKRWLVEEEQCGTQLEIQNPATIKSEDHVKTYLVGSLKERSRG